MHAFTDPDLHTTKVLTTTLFYSDPVNLGRVTQTTSPLSHANSFAYGITGSQLGMLITMTDPLNNVTTFGYDAVGRRTSMVDPIGNAAGGTPSAHTWSYTYDNEDRPLTVSAPDPSGGSHPLVTTYTYDGVGNRTAVTDANGQVTTYIYDARDSLAEVDQSPLTWTAIGSPPATVISATYAYDNLGNLTRATRARADSTNERAVDYTYDGLNRLRSETQYPSWPTVSPTLVMTSTYDLNNNRTQLKDPLGKFTTFVYDALSRLTGVTYSSSTTPNVTYAYDANGNRTSMSDTVNGATTYSYDELNRVVTNTVPGPSTIGYRYDNDGNRTKLIYPGSGYTRTVTYSFDNGDRLTSLLDWGGRTTSYGYNAVGSVITSTLPNGATAANSYDNAQRLTDVWNKSGNFTLDRHSYVLDSVGNRTVVTETLGSPGAAIPIAWGLNASGQIGSTTTGSCSGGSCALGPQQVVGSGGSGNLTAIVGMSAGLSHSVALKSDGTVWSWGDDTYGELGDGNHNTTSGTPVQAMISSTLGLSGIVAVTAGYSYTLALKSDGTVWAWGRNSVGQLGHNDTTDSYYAEQVKGTGGAGTTLQSINAISAGTAHGLALKADGTVVYAWGWNAKGQLGNNTTPTNSSIPVTVTLGLGSGTTITSISAGGQHSLAVTSARNVLAWGWNGNGQLGDNTTTDRSTPVSVHATGGSGTLAGVNAIAAGYQHSLATISGAVWSWGYNVAGQLGNGTTTDSHAPVQVLGVGGTGYLSGISAIAAGGLHSVAVSGTGQVDDWGYGIDGQLAQGNTNNYATPKVVALSGLTAIAAGGYHTLAIATGRSFATTYGYDGMDRLVSGGTPGSPTAYTYDPVGNRLTQTIGQTTTSYTYDKADRITGAGGTSYTLDANGNMTAAGSNTFGFDQANRVYTATVSSQVITYRYDGDGKRVTRTVGANPTVSYVYDANGSLPMILSDGALTYVYGLGLAYTVDITGTVQYLHTDGLGSVRAMTDSSGNLTQTFQTDEFGNPALVQGTSTQPFRYTGQQNDGETGFYDLRARYYAPGIGRFVSRDNVAGGSTNPLTLNRFVYGLDNPINLTDPSGLCVDPGGAGTRFCIETFIPTEYAWGFHGDNRGPNASGGTFRTMQQIFHAADGSWIGHDETGRSGVDTPFGSFERKSDLWTCNAAKASILQSRYIIARCAASDGLAFMFWPPAAYTVMLQLTGGLAKVSTTGTTFPSIEVWQYGDSTEPSLIFHYDSQAAGTGPQNLFGESALPAS